MTTRSSARYEVRDESTPLGAKYVVYDMRLDYGWRTTTSAEHAKSLCDEQNSLWEKMTAAKEHRTQTRVRRLGGSPIRGGGTYRCSEAHCSCGWSATVNGQTYAESMQEIREHLKEVGVYTTKLEQSVYAALSNEQWLTASEIARKSAKTIGRVNKTLDTLIGRGNAEWLTGPGELIYRRTDKWFSWND